MERVKLMDEQGSYSDLIIFLEDQSEEHNKPEYPTEAHGAIPAFNNIEEEAEFWDTHDTTEFEDEFKPVKVHFAKLYDKGI
jgi:CopG antitoxin of type II toxin-antitoxin system